MLSIYGLIFIFLFAIMLIYIYIAENVNIIDKPTERSSHIHPTIRGGGIIFPIAIITWFVIFGWSQPYSVIGLLIISLISFIDDIKSQSGVLRLVVHVSAIGLLFYEADIYNMHWYLLLAAFLLTIGWLNAFNFMDGINSITAFYSLVLLGTFSLLNNADTLLSPFFKEVDFRNWEPFFPGGLVGALFISVLIFTFYNARGEARVFAGDVGSISMAYMQSWMMISLMIATKQAYWIILFSVYGIDTIFTIIVRLFQGENIFKSHRKHLYQLLANEKKWSHISVAITFASIQMFINLVTIYLVFTNQMNLGTSFLIMLGMSIVYIFVRIKTIGNLPEL
jgi:UDP-N-acetylmuramyl pentapeptide phosphotransferase/UDP-N-acetylglucosamine-1-phosphate transferase